MSKPSTYKCPECGGGRFQLTVTQLTGVAFDPDDEDHEVYEQPFGDIEWTDDTHAICEDCNQWSGRLGEAKADINTTGEKA